MASAGDGSNGTPASMKREGTMQRTVREAKECSYGCNCGEIEGEHDHDQVTGQPVAKPSRQTTMEKTAQEGIQFLKDQRKDTLLEAQGLIPARNKGHAATAGSDEEEDEDDEEVEDDEEDDEDTTEPTGGDDDDEPLNGQDDSNSGEAAAKMGKQRTMLATMKEGQDLLDNYMGGKLDPNARTRTQQHESSKAQQKDEDDDEEEEEDNDGPDAKRPRRTHTMLETAQEAQQLVADPHSMGGTRSETAAVKKAEQHASSKKTK